jgi:small subunit ribosomal protein S27Ae
MAEKKKIGPWSKYEISGTSLKGKGKFCPKCGRGVWLADHKDRLTCGTCKYTEFKSKK